MDTCCSVPLTMVEQLPRQTEVAQISAAAIRAIDFPPQKSARAVPRALKNISASTLGRVGKWGFCDLKVTLGCKNAQ